MRSIIVSIKITAEEFQQLYGGAVKEVKALSLDGRRVRFPANVLRPFVTHSGISGTFHIRFSDNNRFQGIEKID